MKNTIFDSDSSGRVNIWGVPVKRSDFNKPSEEVNFLPPDETHADFVLPEGWDKKVSATLDNTKLTETYDFLRSQSENFMSPEDQKLALENLGKTLGVNISILDAEMSRMSGLYARMLDRTEITRVLTAYTAGTEWEKPPMIMALPKTIMVDGVENLFSIATMSRLLPQKIWDTKEVWCNTDYVKEEQRTTTFWDDLRVTTSANLADTKNTPYTKQLDKQKEWADQSSLWNVSIDVRAFLEMVMLHLRNPQTETLMLEDYMRLNAKGTDGDPLDLCSSDANLDLLTSSSFAYSLCGIGASSSLLADS